MYGWIRLWEKLEMIAYYFFGATLSRSLYLGISPLYKSTKVEGTIDFPSPTTDC